MTEVPPYRSATVRARAAMAALGAFLLAEVVAVVADAGRIGITNRILQGTDVSDGEITSSDDLVRHTAVVELTLVALCAVLFLTWLYRVVANGPALGGRGLRFTPGWAVGWWFVPVANLVRPFQAVAEAWGVAGRDQGARLGLLLPAWWGLSVLGVVSHFVAVQSGGDDIAGLRNAAVVDVVASVVLAVDAMLCILLILQLTGRQERARPVGIAA